MLGCLVFARPLRWLCLSLALTILAGCGTWTPLPSHGGGRRFAVEQALVSAAARSAVSQLPLQDLRGQSVNVEVHIIHDEGSGFITGGRPLASDFMSGSASIAQATARGSRTTSLTSGLSTTIRGNEYQNNLYISTSDRAFLLSIIQSIFRRNNINIANDREETSPGSNPPTANILLEIIVDVFGINRSRSDFIITNAENLEAVTSLEYTISELRLGGARRSGRTSAQATYRENYVLWSGPVTSNISVTRADLDQVLGLVVTPIETAVSVAPRTSASIVPEAEPPATVVPPEVVRQRPRR